jgi:hypothetical protein
MCSIHVIKIRTIPSRLVPEKPKFSEAYISKKCIFFSAIVYAIKDNLLGFKMGENQK